MSENVLLMFSSRSFIVLCHIFGASLVVQMCLSHQESHRDPNTSIYLHSHVFFCRFLWYMWRYRRPPSVNSLVTLTVRPLLPEILAGGILRSTHYISRWRDFHVSLNGPYCTKINQMIPCLPFKVNTEMKITRSPVSRSLKLGGKTFNNQQSSKTTYNKMG